MNPKRKNFSNRVMAWIQGQPSSEFHCDLNKSRVKGMSTDPERSMSDEIQKVGNTGLVVSEVALGTMQFGGKMNMGNLGQEDTTRMVK